MVTHPTTGFSPWKNVLGCMVLKPPFVMFLIFIGMFAVAFLSLGYYVQHREITDEEASEQWNHLYSSMLPLTFCISNDSFGSNRTRVTTVYHMAFVNLSIPYNLLILRDHAALIRNTSTLFSLVPYFYLHLKDFHHKIQIWISVDTNSERESCKENEMQAKTCKYVKFACCITLELPDILLPNKNIPEGCNGTHPSSQVMRVFDIVRPGKTDNLEGKGLCGNNVEFSIQKQKNYNTKVPLDWQDRSKVNLRLQVASYILFVVLLSVILYAIIKGKPLKSNVKKMFAT